MFWDNYVAKALRTESNSNPFSQEFIEKDIIDIRFLYGVLGLIGEFGEVKKSLVGDDVTKITLEIGDMFWYLALLSKSSDKSIAIECDVNPTHIPYASNVSYLLNLIEELLYELSENCKKAIFYEKKLNSDKNNYILTSLYSLLVNLCLTQSIDVKLVLITNITKLENRFPDKFNTNDAINKNIQ